MREPEALYNRKLVFGAACLGMLVFGIVMTTLGTILPAVVARFGIDLSGAGSLVSVLSVGILAGSVVFGPIVDRYGYRMLLALCSALVALGLEGIAFAPSVGVLRPAIFLIGFGGGVINGGTNALVADISEQGRSAELSLLGVFYGVGAFSIPFFLSLLGGSVAYSGSVAIVGAATTLPLLYFLTIRFPEPKQAQGFPIKEGMRLIGNTTLLLMGLMLFIQSGIEITIGNWTTSFLTTELGLDSSAAAFSLSFFLLSMTGARLLMGTRLKNVNPARVLRTCIALGVAGALVIIVSQSQPVAVIGLLLIGAGLAAGFPVVLGYVGDCYPRLSGTAFSIVLVIALTGGNLFPYVIGLLGEGFGLRISFVMIPASLLVMALLFTIVLHRIAPVRSGT